MALRTTEMCLEPQTPALGWYWGVCLLGCSNLWAQSTALLFAVVPPLSLPPPPESQKRVRHHSPGGWSHRAGKGEGSGNLVEPSQPGKAPLAHVGLREMTSSGLGLGEGGDYPPGTCAETGCFKKQTLPKVLQWR